MFFLIFSAFRIKCCLVIGLFMLPLLLWGQAVSENSYILPDEGPVTTDRFVIPLAHEGVAILYSSTKDSPRRYRNWTLLHLDTTLTVIFKIDFTTKEPISTLKKYTVDGHFVRMLLSSPSNTYGIIADWQINRRQILLTELVSPVTFEPVVFCTTRHDAYLSGNVNYRPVLLHVNLENGSTRLASGLYEPSTEISKGFTDFKNDLFTLSLIKFKRNKSWLSLKKYGPNGKLVDEQELSGMAGHNLTTLICREGALPLEDSSVSIGTFARYPFEYPQGLFVWQNADSSEYLPFIKTEGFFDFLSVKRKKRLEKYIDKRHEKDKRTSLRYRFLLRQPLATDTGYILMAEGYTPVYQREGSSFINTPQINYDVDGYRHSQAVLFYFDKQMKLTHSKAFSTESKLFARLQERLIWLTGKHILVYYNDNKMYYTSALEAAPPEKKPAEISWYDLCSPDDLYNIELVHWYGDKILFVSYININAWGMSNKVSGLMLNKISISN